jgi:hypothetical protein
LALRTKNNHVFQMITFNNAHDIYLDVQMSVYKLPGNALAFENEPLEKSV